MKMNGKVCNSINGETKNPSSSELLYSQISGLCISSAARSNVTRQCSKILQLTSGLAVIYVSTSGKYYGLNKHLTTGKIK